MNEHVVQGPTQIAVNEAYTPTVGVTEVRHPSDYYLSQQSNSLFEGKVITDKNISSMNVIERVLKCFSGPQTS